MNSHITLTRPKSIYIILSEMTGYSYDTCRKVLRGDRNKKTKAGKEIMKAYKEIKKDYEEINN